MGILLSIATWCMEMKLVAEYHNLWLMHLHYRKCFDLWLLSLITPKENIPSCNYYCTSSCLTTVCPPRRLLRVGAGGPDCNVGAGGPDCNVGAGGPDCNVGAGRPDCNVGPGGPDCNVGAGSSVSHCQTSIPQPIMTKLCSLL